MIQGIASDRLESRCTTARVANPAATRRTNSPTPGQEFGNVENSLCTVTV
jgi:hypothetical protein